MNVSEFQSFPQFLFLFLRGSLGYGLLNISGATSGPKRRDYPQWQRCRPRTEIYWYSMPPHFAICTLDSLESCRGCHAYCQEITGVELCEQHKNPQPVHLILSHHPSH